VAEEIEAAQIGAAPTEEHPTGDQEILATRTTAGVTVTPVTQTIIAIQTLIVEIPVGVMGNLLIPHQPVIADLI